MHKIALKMASLYSKAFSLLWNVFKSKTLLEWQFLFPRWINLEMDTIVNKILIFICFILAFVCLISPYSTQLLISLCTWFVAIWIYGISKDENNINVPILLNQFIIHQNTMIPNYYIFLHQMYLYLLKISPKFLISRLQLPIKTFLQFVTAIWFNDCFQHNVDMVTACIQSKMCEYDAVSYYISKMKLNSSPHKHLATYCPNGDGSDDANNDNFNYYLPISIQKIIIQMCFDENMQQLAREWQVGTCLTYESNISECKLPQNKNVCVDILECLFGDTNQNRINVLIEYDGCQLGGSLSGNFGLPAVCGLTINYGNYGNGKFDQHPSNDYYHYFVTNNQLLHHNQVVSFQHQIKNTDATQLENANQHKLVVENIRKVPVAIEHIRV